MTFLALCVCQLFELLRHEQILAGSEAKASDREGSPDPHVPSIRTTEFLHPVLSNPRRPNSNRSHSANLTFSSSYKSKSANAATPSEGNLLASPMEWGAGGAPSVRWASVGITAVSQTPSLLIV